MVRTNSGIFKRSGYLFGAEREGGKVAVAHGVVCIGCGERMFPCTISVICISVICMYVCKSVRE